jgi:hypothetical protein
MIGLAPKPTSRQRFHPTANSSWPRAVEYVDAVARKSFAAA